MRPNSPPEQPCLPHLSGHAPFVVLVALLTALSAAAALTGLTGCSGKSAAGTNTGTASGRGGGSPGIQTAGQAAAGAANCSGGQGWDCDQQRRFAAAETYMAAQPGTMGAVLIDTSTGATWKSKGSAESTWTASTIKLAIATALLEGQRSGRFHLTDADRANMRAALIESSNDAATALWNKYEPKWLFDRFRSTYGMSGLAVVDGNELFWRNLRCSAEDLASLMAYVLKQTAAEDRAYLVSQLRAVNSAQHWGVMAAGTAMNPGNKDGWAQKPDKDGTHWVTHTVGFAGPGERYAVAVTYRMLPAGTLQQGVQAVSDVVATVFGATVPAAVTGP